MAHKTFRILFILFLILAQFATSTMPVLAASPANDNFADAQSINSLPFSVTADTTDATAEPNEVLGCSYPTSTIWYSFTPSADLVARVSLTGSQVFGAAGVFRASGPGLTDLTYLTCATTYNDTNVLFLAGYTYYIRLDTNFGQPGILQLNIEQITPPANDSFANPEAILSLPASFTINNTNATPEPGEPDSCIGPFRSVWYAFTPAQDMTLRATTQAGTNISIYLANGPAISDLSFIRCSSSGGLPANFKAQAGETYYLQVDSFGAPSSLQFSLEQVTPPANDDFASAQVIQTLPFNENVDITYATVESGEPVECFFPIRSVWYSFIPAQDMTVQLSVTGGLISGAAALYLAQGPDLTDLDMLACATSNVPANFALQAGQTYFFRLDGFGQEGTLQLNLQQIASPANDNFANAETIGNLPFSTTVDNTNTSTEFGEPQNCSQVSHSVWYAYTPAQTTTIRVDSQSSNGFINIYHATGTNISDLQYINCIATGDYFTLQADAGQTYYFQASFYSDGGSLQFDLRQALPPANDAFASAEAIPDLPFNTIPDLTDTGIEPGEPQTCGFSRHTVWYSYTPAVTISVKAQVQSTNGFMAVYQSSGAGMSDLQPIQAASCISSNFPAIFLAEAGQTYYLQAGIAPGNSTDIQIDLQQVTPPANDAFASAEAIASIPFNAAADVTSAWTEPNELQYCAGMNKTVWYAFTPEQTVAVRADTLGSTANANLNVYQPSGAGISNMNFIGCTISSGGTFNFIAQAGQTYYLQVGIYSNDPVTIQVHLQQAFPPANDNLANAEAIQSLPFTRAVDVTDSSTESGEPQYCYMSRSIWYAFTPSETMSLHASTTGSSIGANVNIYSATGSGFQNLHLVTCFGPASSPVFVAEAGKTYYFQVGPAYNEQGTVNFNLLPVVPPPNDNFANAVQADSVPFTASVDVLDATNEPGEPQSCSYMTNTAWYSFTPMETKKYRMDMHGSQLNANVNVYHDTGAGLAGLQFLQCAGYDSSTSFLAEAGETYYFQVGTVGQPGAIQFNLSESVIISGRITDAVSGAPISGTGEPYAVAYLYRVCGDGCLESVNGQAVDGSGRFAFDGYYYGTPLPSGSYFVTVTANLYQTKQFGPFNLNGTNLDTGDLALTPPSVIRGRAVDSKTGSPISGAVVSLLRCDEGGCQNTINSFYTGADGLFQFNSFYGGVPLAGGNYEVDIASDPLYQARQIQVSVTDGENRDLGDVTIDPTPLTGSISGRLVDAVTGKPVSLAFGPGAALYRCAGGDCSFVNNMALDSDGRFIFTTDSSGIPLVIGSYRVYANADQYFFAQTEVPNMVENENRNLGDVRINSVAARFSDVKVCDPIPASGGDCAFSVRVWNGANKSLSGKVWTMTDATLPDTFARSTNFQVGNAQDLDLGKGNSKVFTFKFSVPANMGSYGTYICSRVYVGEGPQSQLNTVGFRYLFCVYRNAGGFSVSSPEQVAGTVSAPASAVVTGMEVEPNNSCQAAQDVGALNERFIMPGDLDSSVSPDIDYFHFTGTPGQPVTIDLEGQSTGKGTLYDPFLGVFGSDCNLVAVNDDSNSLNSHLDLNVPTDGVLILAATTCCDGGFTGGGNGTYQLTVAPVETIGSVSGTVIDAVSGKPLHGDVAPFAYVRLLRNSPFGFSDVNAGFAGSDGSFGFTTDFNGNPLVTGEYMIIASADQYQYTQTDPFTVGKEENYNAGKISLKSFPIRFSDLQTCSVPSDGGQCDFTVKITNGLATKFSGKAWSNIDAYNLGTFVEVSNFQTDTLRDVNLDPGKSMLLKLRFLVRGSVSDGATMCATAYVGQNPGPLFNTQGMRFLFCFVKGSSGFTLTSPQQTQLQMRHMEIMEETRPNPNSNSWKK